MTNAAYGIHNQLAQEGFDLSSDEYYDELNRRIRKAFPHKFRKQADMNVNVPNVAPATRGSTVNGGTPLCEVDTVHGGDGSTSRSSS